MQALMFMFGVGGLLAPLIAEPYLIPHNATGNYSFTKANDYHMAQQLQLQYPYFFLSSLLAGNALMQLILWIVYPETEEHESRNEN